MKNIILICLAVLLVSIAVWSTAAVIRIDVPVGIQMEHINGTTTWNIWSDSCRLFTVATQPKGNVVLTCVLVAP